MPDWLSHLVVGLIIAELFNVRKKSLVLLGALLPDVLTKLSLAFFYMDAAKNFTLSSFHTPVMCFLIAIAITPLFKYNRLKVFYLVSIGVISHFLADLTLKHLTGGMRLFFPFSSNTYILNWMWPEQSFYFILVSLAVYLFILIYKNSTTHHC